MLIEKIRIDQLFARKEFMKTKQSLFEIHAKVLTTLIGESQIDGKDPSDEQLIKVIQKFIKNNEQSLKIKENKSLEIENELLRIYLPRTVTEAQVKQILEENAELNLNKGAKIGLVKVFCQENNLLFDGKLVNLLT